ncbi:hypothetical protein [Pseudonocardia sp.]|jgi:hypothetical protein|uniref:hypothetical protein n=1 Tax=Pseudonocardia sp. TaxID=60912 RepID=UPI002F405059
MSHLNISILSGNGGRARGGHRPEPSRSHRDDDCHRPLKRHCGDPCGGGRGGRGGHCK